MNSLTRRLSAVVHCTGCLLPQIELVLLFAQAKDMTADKDEQGKSIFGTKKRKIEQLLIGMYLTATQKNTLLLYLGYSTNIA